MKKKESNQGFTLIELLVVISIISLLSSVVLVSLNPVRAKARNVHRNADVAQLVKAFNLGLDTGSLPSTGGTNYACLSTSCYGDWSALPAIAAVDSFLAPYINKPTDPSDSSRTYGGYLYAETWYGVGPYDGTVFPSGTYLIWFVELPGSSISCGPGSIYNVSANDIQCLFKLN